MHNFLMPLRRQSKWRNPSALVSVTEIVMGLQGSSRVDLILQGESWLETATEVKSINSIAHKDQVEYT